MKLTWKVSLISLLMTTVTVSVCSLLLLIRSGRQSFDLTVRSVLDEHADLADSWKRAMASLPAGRTGLTAERSYAKYAASLCGDETTALLSGSDMILNRTDIDPSAILPLSGTGRRYVVERIGSSYILTVGSGIAAGSRVYSLYTMRDVTSVFSGVRELANRFTAVHLAALLLCGAILFLLLRAVLRPIGAVSESARRISEGVYSGRIRAEGNDEIAALAISFNRMADAIETRILELREESDRRTMLLSALTHEMKTPVTAISGSAQTLLGTVLTDAEKEEALLSIDSECRRMERLSQKMMQLILLKRTEELPLVPCRLDELFDDVSVSCAEQLRRRSLTLRTDCDAGILPIEKDLMTSLLINLIDNAGKASSPGGEILLRAAGRTISVSDHGAGIAPEDLRHVLEPFYMADRSRARKAGGSGLGLALCDEIARLHHARLEIESWPGTGTTVKVVFPDEA